MYELIWAARAAEFLARDEPLPRMDDAALAAFWPRFRFTAKATLFYADSNMYAVNERIRRYVTEVVSFDTHHDAGYTHDGLERAKAMHQVHHNDWVLGYVDTGVPVHVVYPRWRDDAMETDALWEYAAGVTRGYDAELSQPFDRVFVARSPAWVPSWCDDQFERLIDLAPVARKVNLDDMRMRRTVDMEMAHELVARKRASAAST